MTQAHSHGIGLRTIIQEKRVNYDNCGGDGALIGAFVLLRTTAVSFSESLQRWSELIE